MTLTLITTARPVGPVLRVAGDLDHSSAPQLRRAAGALVLTPGGLLLVDLSGMRFCDSSGITALLAARHRALAAQARFALAGVPANTARILRMTGLDQVFDVYADTDDAAKDLTRPT